MGVIARLGVIVAIDQGNLLGIGTALHQITEVYQV
jgi:hypothetical protein